MKIRTIRSGFCLVALLILLLISCQRSQFATTTRTYKNGRAVYVKHYRLESRRVSQGISSRKQVKSDDLQSNHFSASRIEQTPEISRMEPVASQLSEQLIASTAIEPILALVKEKSKVSTANQRLARNVNLHQDTIGKENKTQTGVQGTSSADNRKMEKHGLTGFILSIFGLIPIVGLPLAILGLVFGIKSLRKIKRNPELYKGKGFAIASIVLGVLGIVGTILMIGLFAAVEIGTNSTKFG
jgi:Domain of unknown function (DUF4190)